MMRMSISRLSENIFRASSFIFHHFQRLVAGFIQMLTLFLHFLKRIMSLGQKLMFMLSNKITLFGRFFL